MWSQESGYSRGQMLRWDSCMWWDNSPSVYQKLHWPSMWAPVDGVWVGTGETLSRIEMHTHYVWQFKKYLTLCFNQAHWWIRLWCHISAVISIVNLVKFFIFSFKKIMYIYNTILSLFLPSLNIFFFPILEGHRNAIVDFFFCNWDKCECKN